MHVLNLAETIKEFILSALVVFDDDAVLNDEDNIFELGFVDSLFALELVSFVEEKFDIELIDEDLVLPNFSSVKAVVALVNRKRNG